MCIRDSNLGANINEQADDGWTALHWAVERKQITNIELLLKRCAKTDIKGDDKRTALTLARRTGNREILSLLKSSTKLCKQN